jgi:hypothetical protein
LCRRFAGTFTDRTHCRRVTCHHRATENTAARLIVRLRHRVAADHRFRAAVPATAWRPIDDATVIFPLFFIFSLFCSGNRHSNKSSVVCVPHIVAGAADLLSFGG